jgi:hypothetical protein
VAGIVEAQQPLATLSAVGVERARLGRVHVGGEAGQPDDARQVVARWRAAAKRDTATSRPRADFKELRFVVDHGQIDPMIRLGFVFAGMAGMADAAAAVNAERSA